MYFNTNHTLGGWVLGYLSRRLAIRLRFTVVSITQTELRGTLAYSLPRALNDIHGGPARHKPHSQRLQKIVLGYNNICLCSLAGYKKNKILRSCSEQYLTQ